MVGKENESVGVGYTVPTWGVNERFSINILTSFIFPQPRNVM